MPDGDRKYGRYGATMTFGGLIMPQIDVSARELTILEFVLTDLAEAIEDGDRPEFGAGEVNELMIKVQDARKQLGESSR